MRGAGRRGVKVVGVCPGIRHPVVRSVHPEAEPAQQLNREHAREIEREDAQRTTTVELAEVFSQWRVRTSVEKPRDQISRQNEEHLHSPPPERRHDSGVPVQPMAVVEEQNE